MARDRHGDPRRGDDQPTEYLRGEDPTQFLGENSPTEYLGAADETGSTRYLGDAGATPPASPGAPQQRPRQYFPPQQRAEETRFESGYAPGYHPDYAEPYEPAGDLSDYEDTGRPRRRGLRAGLVVAVVVVLLVIGALVFLFGRFTGGSGEPVQVTYTEVTTEVETITEQPSEGPGFSLPSIPTELPNRLSDIASDLPAASDVQGWVDGLWDRLNGAGEPTDPAYDAPVEGVQ